MDAHAAPARSAAHDGVQRRWPASPSPAAPPSGPAADPATAMCGAAVGRAAVAATGPDVREGRSPPEQVAAAFAEYRARLEPPWRSSRGPAGLVAQADIGTLARQARYAIENRDVTAVKTPEFQARQPTDCSLVVRDCGYPVIRVVADRLRYRYPADHRGRERRVHPRSTRASEPHELTVYRIDDGPHPCRTS